LVGLAILKVATIGSPVLGTSGITDIVIASAEDLVAIRNPPSKKMHNQTTASFKINPLFWLALIVISLFLKV
jgi:hypothetical protein